MSRNEGISQNEGILAGGNLPPPGRARDPSETGYKVLFRIPFWHGQVGVV